MNARRSTPTDGQPGGAGEGRASSDARATYGRLLLTLVGTLLLSGVIVAFGNGGGSEPPVDPERAANPTPETSAQPSTTSSSTSSSTTTSTVEKKPELTGIACLEAYAILANVGETQWYLTAKPKDADVELSMPSENRWPDELQTKCGGKSFRLCGRADDSLTKHQGARLKDNIIEFENSNAKLKVDHLRDCSSVASTTTQPQVDNFTTLPPTTSTTTSGSNRNSNHSKSGSLNTTTSTPSDTEHNSSLWKEQ